MDAGSPQRWLLVRKVLREHRHRLSGVAARLYPDLPRAGHPDFLGAAAWLPDEPVALGDLALDWAGGPVPPAVDGTGPASAHVRPARSEGGRYATYAEAVAGLDPPALFENRACYRPLAANLLGRPRLSLGETRYFDAVSVGHAVAHELAGAWHDSPGGITMADLPLRALAGDPCDLPRRPAIVAVAALTLRRAPGGRASFVLHWRDPAKVNHAGGLYQVIPTGLFQPVTGTPAGIASDFSLWRCLVREFSEEFLGGSEEYPTHGGRLDYHGWPFYQQLERARRAGTLTVHCLGLGVDPLTFAADILTVVVVDGDVYDAVFGGLVERNAEGRVITGAGTAGIPFDAGVVTHFSGGGEPVQPSGAALLALAWQHRRHLLG